MESANLFVNFLCPSIILLNFAVLIWTVSDPFPNMQYNIFVLNTYFYARGAKARKDDKTGVSHAPMTYACLCVHSLINIVLKNPS